VLFGLEMEGVSATTRAQKPQFGKGHLTLLDEQTLPK